VNGCDLSTMFTDIEFKPSHSASDTIIFTGKLKQSPYSNVILKISPSTNKEAVDNSLYIEREIYTKVINKMYIGRITPHVTPYMGTFRCNDFVRSLNNYLPDATQKLIRRRWDVIQSKKEGLDTSAFSADFITLQMNQGNIFWEYIKQLHPERNPEDHAKLVSIMFQVIYTLHCFTKVGLRHNDLHLNNILIEHNSPVLSISYFLDNDTVFTVPTYGLIAKIFDFDRSSVVSLTPNTTLDNYYCNKLGTCNGENPVCDIYTFIHLIYFQYLKTPCQLKTDIQAIIYHQPVTPTTILYYEDQQRFKSSHIMCKPKQVPPGSSPKCNGEYEWRGKNLPTPEVFLQTLATFQQFRVSPTSVNHRLANTVFADESVRAHFNVKFSKTPSRPVINQNYIQTCLECRQWTGIIKQGATYAVEFRMLTIVFEWLATVFDILKHLKGSEMRRLFATFDEIIEYVQQRAVENKYLQMVSIQFLHKYYPIEVAILVKLGKGAFTESDFKNSIDDVLEFDPICNTTYEYLYYCGTPEISTTDRRELKKNYTKTVNLLLELYTRTDIYMINPLRRAKWVRDIILHQKSADEEINEIYQNPEKFSPDILHKVFRTIEEKRPR
jgi:serine/threonine protein kinase